MTHWKISAKNNWNWGTGKQLVKGMFIELCTPIGTPPLGIPSYHEVIAKAFNTKYSTNFDKSKMNASFLSCEKIGGAIWILVNQCIEYQKPYVYLW